MRIFSWLILFLTVTGMSEPCSWAGQNTLQSLLAQSARPSVAQVKEWLQSWELPPLQNEVNLPKDNGKARVDLQKNYPIWFDALIEGAPEMLVTFEKAFPNATWAFIGRDMSILADMFETFYESIGLPNRVVRIGMSRATLDGLTEEEAFQLVQSSALGIRELKIEEGMTPFIFVDAVSRGGGRQGRFLLWSVINTLSRYSNWKSHFRDPVEVEAMKMFNFIGLRVATTVAVQSDIRDLNKYFHKLRNRNNYSIVTYTAPGVRDSFIGINEAGYEHWTGSWHESFGTVERVNGGLKARPGPPNPPDVRYSTLIYQAHVIQAVQEPAFLKRVTQIALREGIDFSGQLLGRSKAGKVSLEAGFHLLSMVLSLSTEPREFLDSTLPGMENRGYGAALSKNLPKFFEMNPNVTEINELISKVNLNGPIHHRIAVQAVSLLKDRKDFRRLRKPKYSSHSNLLEAQFNFAESAFKKKHPFQINFFGFRFGSDPKLIKGQ